MFKNQIENQIENQIGNQNENQIENENQNQNQIENQIQIENQNQIENQIENQNQILNQNQIENENLNQIENENQIEIDVNEFKKKLDKNLLLAIWQGETIPKRKKRSPKILHSNFQLNNPFYSFPEKSPSKSKKKPKILSIETRYFVKNINVYKDDIIEGEEEEISRKNLNRKIEFKFLEYETIWKPIHN
ncbi:hypothetical protein M0811_13466 [Anaeramoeba ignava]|uniref:Uncharacterized protein n=1 Tax=Anaeramoeba ignava TaxID=1746090 RepID=A0A9Q0R535_ANAIG|nr:hypothetical protein M0811_13466 [Anaeramoeba ignava]